MDESPQTSLREQETQLTEPVIKKAYQPPELHDYGTVQDLTHAINGKSGDFDGSTYINP
ncbi:MAG TPA: hypothetical protein VEF04_03240 [Blastocatellia bacterium]|nr:hypothetical protein [Blastocatellia bacterium]